MALRTPKVRRAPDVLSLRATDAQVAKSIHPFLRAEFAEMSSATRVSKLHAMLCTHNHLNEQEGQAVAVGEALGVHPAAAVASGNQIDKS